MFKSKSSGNMYCKCEGEVELLQIREREFTAMFANLFDEIKQIKNVIEKSTDYVFCENCYSYCKKQEMKEKGRKCDFDRCDFHESKGDRIRTKLDDYIKNKPEEL